MFTTDQLMMVLKGWATVLGTNPTVGTEIVWYQGSTEHSSPPCRCELGFGRHLSG